MNNSSVPEEYATSNVTWPATKITLLYILLGLSWIFLGDRILCTFVTVQDEHALVIIQNIKGSLYVLLTGYFLYILIKSFYRKWKTSCRIGSKREVTFRIAGAYQNRQLGI